MDNFNSAIGSKQQTRLKMSEWIGLSKTTCRKTGERSQLKNKLLETKISMLKEKGST